MSTLRVDPALQARIARLLEIQPNLTSREIAEHLDHPHRDVAWEIVVMVHRRRLEFEGMKPARYRVIQPRSTS